MKKPVLISLVLLCICLLIGCGGGASGSYNKGATHFLISAPATATAGTAFSYTVTALDASNNTVTTYSGTVHFASSDLQASLPGNKMLLNGTGTFSATLNTTGNQTITATDMVTSSITGTSDTIDVSTKQGPSLAITSGNPPSGMVGTGYDDRQGPACKLGEAECVCVFVGGHVGLVCHILESGFAFMATGGVAPYTWSWAAATGSSLPPGLSITTVNGGVMGISGTPTTAGTYNIVVTITDSASSPAHTNAPYSISIAPPPPPNIDTTNAPTAGVNLPYSFMFAAFQGQPPFTWSETGMLPQGLTFSTAGILSGTPSAVGSSPITVMVQDSAGQNATPQDFTIQVFPHGFAPTGSMQSSRSNFTVTLLSTGNVLVAGGQDAIGNTLDMAELYDSSNGTFAPTGSMGAARTWHTATSLSTGKVLMVGGDDASGNAIAAVDLYDRSKGNFSPTGSLQTGRAFHAATVLSSGKVLVTGGKDVSGNSVSSTELYDPSAGTFTTSANMQSQRYSHVAILLSNGNVLVAVGVDGNGNVLATAELFDPKSGTFSPTGSMVSARYFQTATLLTSGKVLVTGGLDQSSQAITTAELYDPKSGTFSLAGSMVSARYFHTATLLKDGTVLVVGGAGTNGTLTSAELFNPMTGQFTPTRGLQTPRFQQAATLLNSGKALVVGGGNNSVNSVASAEVYQ